MALTAAQRLFSLSPKGATEISFAKELKGLQIQALAEVEGRLLLAGIIGTGPQQKSILTELKKGVVHKITELWPLAANDNFAILAADEKKRILVATERGAVAVLDAEGKWLAGSVQTSAPKGPPRRADQAPALAH